MQNIQDLQEKIFFESQNILHTLSKINSKEELLSKQDLFSELTDRISFLRILEKNKDGFQAEELQEIHPQSEAPRFENTTNLEEKPSPSIEKMKEEVIFTNELNEIDNQETNINNDFEVKANIDDYSDKAFEKLNLSTDSIPNENSPKFNENQDTETSLFVEHQEPDYSSRVSEKEKEFLELEERRRKIVDFNREPSHSQSVPETTAHEKTHENLIEKKFKLASIKGLKAVQNLFDEDPLEKLQENTAQKESPKLESGSILKTNIETDFMEAAKKQPEFKLDFNDKIAFTKMLFAGDEEDLKKTINKLNSFHNLEDAKQYLSEIYYSKNWVKADEYAQRLWDLVESKF